MDNVTPAKLALYDSVMLNGKYCRICIKEDKKNLAQVPGSSGFPKKIIN
jgi:copper chaperone CopZ